jgi:putative membrane protein
MTQKEKTINHLEGDEEPSKRASTSKRVTDHLANERTFLAWIRTGIATIAFGFVVERFGLLLRQLGIKTNTNIIPVHLSSFFGIALTLLGVIMMIVALMNFMQIRRSIDTEQFHPRTRFAIILTILASLIGILLAIYLLLTA